MLDKPAVSDQLLITCLQDCYDLSVQTLRFLPLGYDSMAGVYRVTTTTGEDYFLKLKRGTVGEAALLFPYHLRQSGIEQVVAPLAGRDDQLWQEVDGWRLALYPFIDGKIGMEVGLSPEQWIELGRVLRQIHASSLPPDRDDRVGKESFIPKWGAGARILEAKVLGRRYGDPLQQELADFWRGKQDEIDRILTRTDELSQLLLARQWGDFAKRQPGKVSAPLPSPQPLFVICHADIHTFNVLITADGRLHIIDWDEALLAPKERDLMFLTEGTGGHTMTEENEALFLEGYGKGVVDRTLMAYYRYEWVVQEIGEFGRLIFDAPEVGREEKERAAYHFRELFAPGDVIETAYRSDV